MIIYGKEKEILKAQKRSLAAWINNSLGKEVFSQIYSTNKKYRVDKMLTKLFGDNLFFDKFRYFYCFNSPMHDNLLWKWY